MTLFPEPGEPGYMWIDDRAAQYLITAAGVDADELQTAARVMARIAAADLSPLRRAMTTDSSGNPITNTPERRQAWSLNSSAQDASDRARGWARNLEQASGGSGEHA